MSPIGNFCRLLVNGEEREVTREKHPNPKRCEIIFACAKHFHLSGNLAVPLIVDLSIYEIIKNTSTHPSFSFETLNWHYKIDRISEIPYISRNLYWLLWDIFPWVFLLYSIRTHNVIKVSCSSVRSLSYIYCYIFDILHSIYAFLVSLVACLSLWKTSFPIRMCLRSCATHFVVCYSTVCWILMLPIRSPDVRVV